LDFGLWTLDLIEARFTNAAITAADLDHRAWEQAQSIQIVCYWSGAAAPAGRQAEARVLWTKEALLVRFVCRQAEPLIVSVAPQLEHKAVGLWDRDVCELFIAPRADEPKRYFEFEVAPTGEWLDLAIRQLPDKRETDVGYQSGMTAAARIDEGSVTMALNIPFAALGGTPQAGARWRANLYRCIGEGSTRGYLTWQPTFTPQPNFHVPDRFGWLKFTD